MKYVYEDLSVNERHREANVYVPWCPLLLQQTTPEKCSRKNIINLVSDHENFQRNVELMSVKQADKNSLDKLTYIISVQFT